MACLTCERRYETGRIWCCWKIQLIFPNTKFEFLSCCFISQLFRSLDRRPYICDLICPYFKIKVLFLLLSTKLLVIFSCLKNPISFAQRQLSSRERSQSLQFWNLSYLYLYSTIMDPQLMIASFLYLKFLSIRGFSDSPNNNFL